jgi:hypothetical protein
MIAGRRKEVHETSRCLYWYIYKVKGLFRTATVDVRQQFMHQEPVTVLEIHEEHRLLVENQTW